MSIALLDEAALFEPELGVFEDFVAVGRLARELPQGAHRDLNVVQEVRALLYQLKVELVRRNLKQSAHTPTRRAAVSTRRRRLAQIGARLLRHRGSLRMLRRLQVSLLVGCTAKAEAATGGLLNGLEEGALDKLVADPLEVGVFASRSHTLVEVERF